MLETHASKNSIENHFDTSSELESMLERRVKRQLLDEVQSICPRGITLLHVRQGEALGLGHAISCVRPAIGDAPFAVILPDVFIDDYLADAKVDNLAAMIRRFHQQGGSQVMVEPVAREKVSSYGVVDVGGRKLSPGESTAMTAIVEKPAIQEAPSNLAVVGRYVLSAAIWDILEQTAPDSSQEIQLTDAIGTLMARELMEAFHIQGRSHDCGNKQGYLQTFVTYGLRHPALGAEFGEFLRTLGSERSADPDERKAAAVASHA